MIDVFGISAGFVLRAVGGAVVIGVPVSPWLYVCTVLGSLFLALGKRRNELELLKAGAGGHRKNLEQYTLELVDQLILIVASVTIMAYSLYTFTAENLPRDHSMMLTIPLVLYGALPLPLPGPGAAAGRRTGGPLPDRPWPARDGHRLGRAERDRAVPAAPLARRRSLHARLATG